MKIIDAHVHIYPDPIAVKAAKNIGKFYNGVKSSYDGRVSTLLHVGAQAGVSQFLVQSVATTPHQVDSINRFIAKTVSENPEKFFGFATLHPRSENLPQQVDWAIAAGLHGFKLHPDFQQFDADGLEAMRMYEVIDGRLPILIHAGDYRTQYSKAYRIANAMRKFPKQEFIAAHLGGWSEWGKFAQELAELGVYVDTSSCSFMISPEKIRKLIDIFGVDHTFFGSDFPMGEERNDIEMLRTILNPEEQELVFHENFERFMKKY